MKNTYQKSSKNGFTIVEMIIVMVIIGVILSAVIAVGQGATNTSRIASTTATIKAIQTAATSYYNANGGSYSGGTLGNITLANLASNGYLPTKVAGTDAWGGAITVAPDTNANYFDITLAGVPNSTVYAAITAGVSNLTSNNTRNLFSNGANMDSCILNKKGFTMLEVTVVVLIVGVILSMLIPNCISRINQAKYEKTVSELTTIAQASVDYFNFTGSWPDSANWASELYPKFIPDGGNPANAVTSSPFWDSLQYFMY